MQLLRWQGSQMLNDGRVRLADGLEGQRVDVSHSVAMLMVALSRAQQAQSRQGSASEKEKGASRHRQR